MKLTQKMKAAERTLQRRYREERRDRSRAGNYEPVRCDAKLDRIVLTAIAVSLHALCAIPGYRAKQTERLWKKLYGEVTRIYGTGSIREVVVESAPAVRWLVRYRVTITPRDETGVLLQDLALILELLPQFKIVLLEISLDFPIQSVVDPWFVHRHLLCGKTRMPLGPIPLHEKWGTSRSSKTVRSYAKFVEILCFRIEIQLNSRFLRKHQINHASDFPKLATILPRHHIHFASLDHGKLRQHLQRSGLPHKTKTAILKSVAESRKSLWSTLRLLRRRWHFVNVRRLLTPLAEMNGIVVAALNQWATQWKKHSTPLTLDETQEQQSQQR
jgi:hypothetical protein